MQIRTLADNHRQKWVNKAIKMGEEIDQILLPSQEIW